MGISGKSLNVLTPMYGGMAMGNYIESLLKLMAIGQRYGISMNYTFTYNESLISRARNRLVDEFIKNSKATHAVFIDADIGFNPEDIMAMLESDFDIAGAPCSKKNIRWDRIQRMLSKNGRQYSPVELASVVGDFVFNFEEFAGKREIKIQEPQEMRNVGTGLMMVRRNVFEKFKESFPDRWYDGKGDASALPGPIHDFFHVGINPQTHVYDSEDYWFCVEAKSLGFKVMLLPWIRTTHMGSFQFVGDMRAVAALAGEI